MIKLRRMKWVGLAARIGADERCIQVFGGETRGKETTWKTQAWMGGKYSGSGLW